MLTPLRYNLNAFAVQLDDTDLWQQYLTSDNIRCLRRDDSLQLNLKPEAQGSIGK